MGQQQSKRAATATPSRLLRTPTIDSSIAPSRTVSTCTPSSSCRSTLSRAVSTVSPPSPYTRDSIYSYSNPYSTPRFAVSEVSHSAPSRASRRISDLPPSPTSHRLPAIRDNDRENVLKDICSGIDDTPSKPPVPPARHIPLTACGIVQSASGHDLAYQEAIGNPDRLMVREKRREMTRNALRDMERKEQKSRYVVLQQQAIAFPLVLAKPKVADARMHRNGWRSASRAEGEKVRRKGCFGCW